MPWASWGVRRWWLGAVVTIAVGAALATLNVVMMRSSGPTRAGGRVNRLLEALGAGISEELGMRLCLFALCVYALGRLPRTRPERLLTYLVVIVPHAAGHYLQIPSQMLAGTIVLGVLFGLPLSVLLTRYGLLSAAVAHTVIDAVRVLVLGS